MPRTRNVTRAQWQAAEQDIQKAQSSGGHSSHRESRSSARPKNSGRGQLHSDPKLKLGDRVKEARANRAEQRITHGPLMDITAQVLAQERSRSQGIGGSSVKGGWGKANAKESRRGKQHEKKMNKVVDSQHFYGDDEEGEETEKENQSVVRPKRNHPFPSSLPPSSPPSISTPGSSLPLADSYSVPEAVEQRQGDRDWDEGVPEEPQYSNNSNRSSSDPFGFMALERRLKDERGKAGLKMVNKKRKMAGETEAGGLVLVPESSFVSGWQKEGEEEAKGEEEENLPHHVYFSGPSTPRKSKRIREGNIFSPQTMSMPSTPSPLKPRIQRPVRNTSIVKENDGATRGEKRRKTEQDEGGRSSKRRARSPGDPDSLAKTLTALLPKRPRTKEKKNTKTKAKKRKADRAPLKIEANDNDIKDAKLAQERVARIEYFRKLDGYSLQTENVYVV